ncbi:MAG: hypothetical protein ACRC2B_15030, partial [Rubrivivax sp.]
WCALGVALFTLAVPLAGAAPPQTVYRCGPDGRVYSQTPCVDGRPVTADDPRSASQQKAARDVAERDARQAQQLAGERKQREDSVKGQPAAGIKTAPAAESASAPVRKPKAKAPAPDVNMSAPMRVPVQTPASK